MPHIHDLIDFTVGIYIIYHEKVLLIDHKLYSIWLPIGGHIELDEDPEQALHREVMEECGLKVTLLSKKEDKIDSEYLKSLPPPNFMDIHKAGNNHKHMNLVYFARADTDQVVLEEAAHNAIRWFSKKDLDDPKYKLLKEVKFYAKKALKLAQ